MGLNDQTGYYMISKRIILIFLGMFFINLSLKGQEASAGNISYQKIESITSIRLAVAWKFAADKTVAVTDDGLRFYENGAVRDISLPADLIRTVFSKNARFYATVSLNPLKGELLQEKELSVTVYTSEAKKLYTIKRTFYYDRSLPSVNIAVSDGALILGENDSGELWFYNSRGELLNQVVLFPESSYDLEKTLQVDISGDGSTVAVLAGKRGSSPAGSAAPNSDSEPHLILFNLQGNEIWRRALPEESSSALAISPDGQFTAVNNFTITMDGKLSKKTIVFNSRGQKTGSAGLLFKHAAFSPDSKFLVVAENWKISFIDLSKGIELWNGRISPKSSMVAALAVSAAGKRTVLLVAENRWDGHNFVYESPVIQVYDQQGELLQNINVPGESFIQPSLQISTDGLEIRAGFENSFEIFREK